MGNSLSHLDDLLVFTKFESLLSGYLHSLVVNSAQFSG